MQYKPDTYADAIKKRRLALKKVSPLVSVPFEEDENIYSFQEDLSLYDDSNISEIIPNYIGCYGIEFIRKSFENNLSKKYFGDGIIYEILEGLKQFRLIISTGGVCGYGETEIFSEIELESNKFGKIFTSFYDLLALSIEFNYQDDFKIEDFSEKEKEEEWDYYLNELNRTPEKSIISPEEFIKMYYNYFSIYDCPIQYFLEGITFYKTKNIKSSEIPLVGKIEFSLGT